MIPTCRPLTNPQWMSILRKYPALTSAIAGAASAGISDASMLDSIFDANTGVLDDIVAAGTGLSLEQVEQLGWRKLLCGFQILAQTIADQPNRPPLDLGDLAPLVHGSGALQ